MSGGCYGDPGESAFAWVFGLVSVAAIGLVFGLGFVLGDFNGAGKVYESYGKQAPWGYKCVEYGERQFADVGWFLVRGSGEVRTKTICVHAEMRR